MSECSLILGISIASGSIIELRPTVFDNLGLEVCGGPAG